MYLLAVYIKAFGFMVRLHSFLMPSFLHSKKHILILLRFLIAAIIATVAFTGEKETPLPWQFYIIILFYVITNITLFIEKVENFYSQWLSSVIFIYDIGIVGLSLYYLGGGSREIYLIFSLLILLSAISKSTAGAFFNCIAVSAIFTLFCMRDVSHVQFLSAVYFTYIIFFFVIALFAGYLAEEATRERAKRLLSEKAYREIFDNAAIGIAMAEENGRIVRANRAVQDMLGVTETELLGKNFSAFVQWIEGEEEITLEKCLARPKKDQDFRNIRFGTPLTEEKAMIDARLFSTRIYVDDQVMIQFIVRNISTEKNYYDKMTQLSKMQALGLLVAGIAHDINNPLTSVIGFSDIFRKHALDAQKDNAQRIYDNAIRCKMIVDKLLTFSRHHKSEKKLCEIHKLLQDMFELTSSQFKVFRAETRKQYYNGELFANVDPYRFVEALVNILANAYQAMEETEIKILTVNTDLRDNIIYIRISDTGKGISREIKARLFEPFFTTKPADKGVGLGLSISYSIINEYGGEIDVESEIGKGTIFTIKLPAAMKANPDK